MFERISSCSVWRRVTAAGAALAAIMLTAACATGNQGAAELRTTPQNTQTFRTGVPTKEVDQIRWYTFYRQVMGVQAAMWNDFPEMMVNANLCESVVRLEPDFSLKPGLTAFTVSPDYTRFTYTVRPGAKFWDGSSVTAADIEFSIRANTMPPTGVQNAQIGNEIQSIEQSGTDTVIVTLHAPDINFNFQMASTAGKIYQREQAVAAGEHWGDAQGKVMCTGPYKLGRWDPASSLEIVRNDDYWGPDFKPLVKSVVFSWPQDPATLANAFRGGTLDGGWSIPPAVLRPLQSSDAGSTFVGEKDTGVQLYGLVVGNVEKGPLADPRIRKAFSASLDRDALASRIYLGAADPAPSLIPAGSFTYEAKAFQEAAAKIPTKADLDGAKKLIAQTGQPAPTITLAVPAGDSLAVPTATEVQAEAARAGFTVKLLPLSPSEFAQLFTDPKARSGVDLFFLIYAPPVRDPLSYFNDLIDANGIYNYNGYNNPMVQSLLADARRSTDLVHRADCILKIQERFLKDLPLVPLAAPRVTLFERKDITGAPTTFTYLQSPWAALIGGK